MSLVTTVEKRGRDGYCVNLTGKLDTETAQACADTMAPMLRQQPKILLFNLEGLEFISSMGIRLILKTRKEIENAGGVVTMTNVQPQVQRIFDIVAVLPKTSIFESMEEADRYFATIQKKVLDQERLK